MFWLMALFFYYKFVHELIYFIFGIFYHFIYLLCHWNWCNISPLYRTFPAFRHSWIFNCINVFQRGQTTRLKLLFYRSFEFLEFFSDEGLLGLDLDLDSGATMPSGDNSKSASSMSSLGTSRWLFPDGITLSPATLLITHLKQLYLLILLTWWTRLSLWTITLAWCYLLLENDFQKH